MRGAGSQHGWLSVGGAVLALWPGAAPGNNLLEADLFCRHYLLRVWETDDGLPQNSAIALAQTPDGFLWVATFGGLARFDGARFTVFNRANTPAFTSEVFLKLLVDRQGRLWAGGQDQLACWERGQWRSHARSNGLPAGPVRSLAEDGEGRLVLGTGLGLYRLAGDRLEELPAPPQPGYLGWQCVADAGGTLWAMSSRFFGRLAGGRWQTVLPTPPAGQGFEGLAPARDGGVWLADKTHLRRFQETNCTRALERPAWFRATGPVSLLEDSRGHLWAGGFNKGLLVADPGGQVLKCGREQGLQSVGIRGLFEDREGNVWVGTDGGGLARVKPRTVIMYGEEAGLRQRLINAVTEEAPGRLLVGSHGGGLVRFEAVQGRFDEPITAPGLPLQADSLLLTVLRDRAGVIWAGTYEDGLFRLVGGHVERVPVEQTGSRRITALYQSRLGPLWIGTDSGLVRHEAGRFARFGTNDGLPAGRVIALSEDVRDLRGALWVGTARGLFRQQGARFEPVPVPPGLAEARILALHADRSGGLWIGARNRGLTWWRDGQVFEFGPAQGLAASNVACILEDDAGHLWLAVTHLGLVRVSRAALDAVAAGKAPRVQPLVLNKSDGLSTLEFHSGTQPAGWKSADGRLWWATLKGLATLEPAAVPVNALPPPVHLTGGQADGQALALPAAGAGPLRLPPGTQRVQIQFAAPSFTAPEKVRFQYRLDGLDRQWLDAGSQRGAEFSGLRPGHYRFRVRAANNDGVWNETGAVVALVQRPWWWQRLGVRLGALALVAGGVGGLVWSLQQRRLRRLERQAAQRAQAQALRSTEARYRALFESTSDGIFILEGEGAEAGRILSANPAAAAMHGYTVEELLGRRIQDLDAPEARAKTGGRLLRPEGAEKLLFELEHRRKDGSVFPVEVTVNHMRVEGHLYILAIERDITERRRAAAERAALEAQLRRAQKLEAIGTLAGGIAHDFNNILTGIVGNAEMARLELSPGHPARDYLAELLKAAQRARDSVAQILSFSRQKEPRRSLIALWPVVQDALKLLRASLPATIEIRTLVPPTSPAVLADASQLFQVLMNLGTNAAQAIGPNPGVIEVSQTVVEVDAALARTHPQLREGRYLRLAVRDSGHGMDAATLERIFEPFFTTKPPGEGTGLGLAVVHGIMQDHDGAVTVESQPGQGTTFYLWFPAVEAPTSDTPTPRPSLPRGAGQRILFVDDEPGVAQLGRTLLQRLGYQVSSFTNPEEALAALRATPRQFDLVITDLTMPKMTGPDLARRLRETQPNTPVVLTTGFSASMDVDKARQMGFCDLLPKPFTLQSFAQTVHRVLSAHAGGR